MAHRVEGFIILQIHLSCSHLCLKRQINKDSEEHDYNINLPVPHEDNVL